MFEGFFDLFCGLYLILLALMMTISGEDTIKVLILALIFKVLPLVCGVILGIRGIIGLGFAPLVTNG